MDGPTLSDMAAHEEAVIEMIKKHFPQWGLIRSGNEFACYDSLAYDINRKVVSVIEIKARNFSFEELIRRYGASVMIDRNKWDNLKELGDGLKSGVDLFTYLIQDRVLLKTALFDSTGKQTCEASFEKTRSPDSYKGKEVEKDVVKIATNGSTIVCVGSKNKTQKEPNDINRKA